MIRHVLVAVLLVESAPVLTALAQPLDNRLQSITFEADTPQRIETSSDIIQTVLFERGEQIRSVLLSDPSAFFVSISGSGDSLVLRANGPGAQSVMTVETNLRQYRLQLVGSAGIKGDRIPQIIRFTYGAATGDIRRAPDASPPGISWRLSGDVGLRPAKINDDGEKTYISWPEKVPMPVVFAVDSRQREQLVDGYVRAGFYTIDRVYERLIFRIDRREAMAKRVQDREAVKHD